MHSILSQKETNNVEKYRETKNQVTALKFLTKIFRKTLYRMDNL